MIAWNHNARIFIKILFLNPADKVIDLTGRTVENICILVIRISIFTEPANIAVRKMGVYGEQSKVEGSVVLCQIQQFFLCIGKKLFIFEAPVYPIISGKFIFSLPITEIFHSYISVVFHKKLSTAKIAYRTQKKFLGIAFFLQNIAQCGDGRKEMLLTVHRVLLNGNL